jgi:hypothetical protein
MNTALHSKTITTIKYPRRTTSAAAESSLGTTIKYLCATACVGLGTTFKYLRGAAGIGLGTTIKELRRSASCVAGNGLRTTTNLRGAAGIGLGAMIKYLRPTTSAAANNGRGTTTKYLVNQNAGAGNNWAKAHVHEYWAPELEIELVQTQITQMTVLRAGVYSRALCASQKVKRAEVWLGPRCAL